MGNRKVLTRVVFDKIRAQRYLNPIRRHLWIMPQTLNIKFESMRELMNSRFESLENRLKAGR